MSIGVPPAQSNLSTETAGSAPSGPNADTPAHLHPTHDLPHDGSTATSTSNPNAHLGGYSSAGRNDHESTLANAGGVHGDRQQTHRASSDPFQAPPAQEMSFTKKEIDEAANVTSSHENPHTIGLDGHEESLEEAGGFRQPEGTDADGERKHGKQGIGAKVEHLKEKVLKKH